MQGRSYTRQCGKREIMRSGEPTRHFGIGTVHPTCKVMSRHALCFEHGGDTVGNLHGKCYTAAYIIAHTGQCFGKISFSTYHDIVKL